MTPSARGPARAGEHAPAGADVEERADVGGDDLLALGGVVHPLPEVVEGGEAELGDAVDRGAPGVRGSTTTFCT